MNNHHQKTHLSWNHSIEEVVKHIGESSKAYKIMHIKEAQKANEIYNYLMLSGIVLGPMAGIVSAIGSSLNISSYPSITISQIILGFLSGIFIAILKFGKYDEISSSNKSAAAKYSSLEANVRRQLSLYRSDRITAKDYIEWLETKYEEIVTSAPLLSNNVFEQYTKLAKENNWIVPDQYNEVIDINQEYEDEKAIELFDKSRIITIEEDLESDNMKKSKNLKNGNVVQIFRTNTMAKIPEINSCSDQMLNYEMKRMMGTR